MSDQDSLKSAYELAMERLQAEDREHGVEAPKPVTKAQKKKIKQLREEAQAKLAELEILHGKAISSEADPEKLAELEQCYRIDRGRVESRLESAIARARRGES